MPLATSYKVLNFALVRPVFACALRDADFVSVLVNDFRSQLHAYCEGKFGREIMHTQYMRNEKALQASKNAPVMSEDAGENSHMQVRMLIADHGLG